MKRGVSDLKLDGMAPTTLTVVSRHLRPLGLSPEKIHEKQAIKINGLGLEEATYGAKWLLDWQGTCSRWGSMVEMGEKLDMLKVVDRAVLMSDKPGCDLLIRGASAKSVCIGDTYAIFQDLSSADDIMSRVTAPRNRLLLQVSCPAPDGAWHLRVLGDGELVDGDVLELQERPHPQWSVQRVAAAKSSQATAEELRELAAMAELASTGWRATFAQRLNALEASARRSRFLGASIPMLIAGAIAAAGAQLMQA